MLIFREKHRSWYHPVQAQYQLAPRNLLVKPSFLPRDICLAIVDGQEPLHQILFSPLGLRFHCRNTLNRIYRYRLLLKNIFFSESVWSLKTSTVLDIRIPLLTIFSGWSRSTAARCGGWCNQAALKAIIPLLSSTKTMLGLWKLWWQICIWPVLCDSCLPKTINQKNLMYSTFPWCKLLLFGILPKCHCKVAGWPMPSCCSLLDANDVGSYSWKWKKVGHEKSSSGPYNGQQKWHTCMYLSRTMCICVYIYIWIHVKNNN